MTIYAIIPSLSYFSLLSAITCQVYFVGTKNKMNDYNNHIADHYESQVVSKYMISKASGSLQIIVIRYPWLLSCSEYSKDFKKLHNDYN